jgi:hypothetical protein
MPAEPDQRLGDHKVRRLRPIAGGEGSDSPNRLPRPGVRRCRVAVSASGQQLGKSPSVNVRGSIACGTLVAAAFLHAHVCAREGKQLACDVPQTEQRDEHREPLSTQRVAQAITSAVGSGGSFAASSFSPDSFDPQAFAFDWSA